MYPWLFCRLQPIVASSEAVPIRRQARSGIRFDKRQRGTVLLTRYFHQQVSRWRRSECFLCLHLNSQTHVIYVHGSLLRMVRKQSGVLEDIGNITVSELQHLIYDSRLVVDYAHVLQYCTHDLGILGCALRSRHYVTAKMVAIYNPQ